MDEDFGFFDVDGPAIDVGVQLPIQKDDQIGQSFEVGVHRIVLSNHVGHLKITHCRFEVELLDVRDPDVLVNFSHLIREIAV
jgi:hypothetical protein